MSVCTECCHDNPTELSPVSKLYHPASGGSVSIGGYLFSNRTRRVMQSLSPLAGRLRGKIGQRHLVCKHRWKASLQGLHNLFCRHSCSSFEYLYCKDYHQPSLYKTRMTSYCLGSYFFPDSKYEWLLESIRLRLKMKMKKGDVVL